LEHFEFKFHRGRKPAFDEVPPASKRQIFGVNYIHLKGQKSGDLFLTRYGWGVIESLLPEHWFVGKRFSKIGRALEGATGAVYKVPVPHPTRDDFAIVVKFSRCCQTVGVTAVNPDLNFSQERIERIEAAQFLPPFEEFGNLYKLRKAVGAAMRTEAPLAIYCPASRFLDWQLGRQGFLKDVYDRNLRLDQEHLPEESRLKYDWERQYILLYRWLEGIDVEQAYSNGSVTESKMKTLGRDARLFMEDHGWEVLDHKPRHVILCTDKHKRMVSKNEDLVWGLVDYELLYPYSG
jgi:hypothetical protein